MTDINIVISGKHEGKKVHVTLGKVFISTSTFGQEPINDKVVQDFDVLKEARFEDTKIYTVSIIFKSGETSLLNVDSEIYKALLVIWPDKKTDRLGALLKEGYNVVGFSSCVLAQSGLGAGAISHNVLLQKGVNIEKVSFVTMGDKLTDGHTHIFHSE